MSSDRQVIPPSRPDGDSPAHVTIELLQKRLHVAEDDTRNLIQHLGQLGFNPGDVRKETEMRTQDAVSPYQPRFADAETLARNYENLVSRVCKTESILQTLKLNMINLQTKAELHKKDSMSANEKLVQAVEAYERDQQKWARDMERSESQLNEAIRRRNEAENHVRQLTAALNTAASSSTVNESSRVQELEATKQKLARKASELRDELTRESNLRASFEESHKSLLTRIKDMEEIVESERNEVKTLYNDCNGLRREVVKTQDELQKEHQLRMKFEEQIVKLSGGAGGRKSTREKALEEDKRMLLGQLSKISGQYQDLNKQLEAMQSMFDQRQDTHVQLAEENRQLNEALKSAKGENSMLAKKYEQQLQSVRSEWEIKLQKQDDAVFVREEVRQVNKQKEQLEQKISSLQEQLSGVKGQLADKDRESRDTSEEMAHEVSSLRQQLTSMQEERANALTEKETLLDEVNQAVDSMTEERSRLQTELQECQLEVQTLQQAKTQLEQENCRLMERIGSVEQYQSTQKHLDKAMAEMLEQKNKLAYENGRLQSRIEQLQSELETLAQLQCQATDLRKRNELLEVKYTKAQSDIGACRIANQRLENQLKQSHASSERKEIDFNMAIQARDQAMKETQRLASQIEGLEEKERIRIQSNQQSLAETKEDTKKMASTLESVMSSHSDLQLSVERLQMELGKKDAQIAALKNERSQIEQVMRQLHKEVELLQGKLMAMETLENNEIEPLRQALDRCKHDNSQIASSLEGVLSSNTQLQATVQRLQDELMGKTQQISQLRDSREQEYSSMKEELRMYEERLDGLKGEMRKERDKSLKKTNKEVAEVKRHQDDLLSKNGELSRANTQLRHKISDLEQHIKELKEKISGYKTQIDHLQRVKKEQEQSLHRMKSISEEVEELDRVKQEYMAKNADQARTISSFVAQIESLQLELRNIVRSQGEMADTIKDRERQLKKEKERYAELLSKHEDTKKREEELDYLRQKTEDKLLEANNESMQISSSLQDAHEWFKTKFEHLQAELLRSRKTQEQLEQENYEQRQKIEEEKRRAQDTAERAREMLRASRQSVKTLADHAELTDYETREHMQHLGKKLAGERMHAKYMDKKFTHLQESSSRQLEALLRDLDDVQTRKYDDY